MTEEITAAMMTGLLGGDRISSRRFVMHSDPPMQEIITTDMMNDLTGGDRMTVSTLNTGGSIPSSTRWPMHSTFFDNYDPSRYPIASYPVPFMIYNGGDSSDVVVFWRDSAEFNHPSEA